MLHAITLCIEIFGRFGLFGLYTSWIFFCVVVLFGGAFLCATFWDLGRLLHWMWKKV